MAGLHLGKIVPGSAGAAQTLPQHMRLVLPELLWGSRALQKVPVEFYIQMNGRENKHFPNSRSRTLCTASSCARTREIRGRERWVILVVDIISYLEMCAEHVLSRSTSTPSIPVSAFFTAFFG